MTKSMAAHTSLKKVWSLVHHCTIDEESCATYTWRERVGTKHS